MSHQSTILWPNEDVDKLYIIAGGSAVVGYGSVRTGSAEHTSASSTVPENDDDVMQPSAVDTVRLPG